MRSGVSEISLAKKSVKKSAKKGPEGISHSLDTKSGQCEVTGQAGQQSGRSGVTEVNMRSGLKSVWLTGSVKRWGRTDLGGAVTHWMSNQVSVRSGFNQSAVREVRG